MCALYEVVLKKRNEGGGGRGGNERIGRGPKRKSGTGLGCKREIFWVGMVMVL